jgi:hypothetical protein
MPNSPKASIMPDTPPFVDPRDTLPREIVELFEVVEALPPDYRHTLEPALTRLVRTSWRRRRILTTIQESLRQLRLDMKYLMFDLEATRRERDALRGRQD